jgi:hypothetical protein
MKRICIIAAILLSTFSLIQAQWKQTKVAIGESIVAFASMGNTIYAGTQGDSIYLSTDNGATWYTATGKVGDTITSLVISDKNLLAGTKGSGIFRSSNNGNSWNTINTGLGNDTVLSLASSGGSVFAGTQNGVYYSTDNGTTWSVTALTSDKVISIAISGTDIYAGTEVSAYHSTNSGTSWARMGLSNYPVYSFAFIGTSIFIGSNGGFMFSTSNNGANWNIFPIHQTNDGIKSLLVVGDYILAGTFGEGVFITSDTNTTDKGDNWSDVNDGLSYGNVNSLAASGGELFAGTSLGGIWERHLSEIITDVAERTLPSINMNLYQSYPNPFTTSTHIALSSIKYVERVSITDMLGKEVTSFPKDSFYNIEWTPDASVPAGTYFLMVKTPTGITSKPIVLLR